MGQPTSNSNTTCKFCGGRGGMATPNGKAYQGCPVCGGTGVAQNVIRVPWSLEFNTPALAVLQANVPVVVQQDTDADFEWLYTMATSILSNNNPGLFSVQPQDLATGRLLSQSAVNGELFAGTGQLPFVMPEPYIISRGSAFKLIFNNRDNTSEQTNTVQVVLWGYKLFPASAPMQGSAGAIVSNG